MTNRSLLIKLITITVLSLLLMIPLSMVSEQINDRRYYHQQAEDRISTSWSGPQVLSGPRLVIPYKVRRTYEQKEDDGSVVKKTSIVKRELIVQPGHLAYETQIDLESLFSGIYELPVYTSNSDVSGYFSLIELETLNQKKNLVSIGKPRVVVHIQDVRGIVEKPVILFEDEQKYSFSAGSGYSYSGNAIHALLEDRSLGLKGNKVNVEEADAQLRFRLNLRVRGSQYLRFLPVAEETKVSLSSNWPHPKFTGRYLPVSRNVSENGFSASWSISAIAIDRRAQRISKKCGSESCQKNTFGVDLIEPVNIYSQSERSTKYAILFIGLMFIAFLLFEVIKKLPVHPIQYSLVGMALVVFYLLLFALSEQFSFFLAYLIAAIASSLLISWYLRYVFFSRKLAAVFFASISTLYALLYGIIQSEDHAMLMGSMLIFLMLALTMISTRNVNWYQLTAVNASPTDNVKTKEGDE